LIGVEVVMGELDEHYWNLSLVQILGLTFYGDGET
jgi:hypothetical protein